MKQEKTTYFQIASQLTQLITRQKPPCLEFCQTLRLRSILATSQF